MTSIDSTGHHHWVAAERQWLQAVRSDAERLDCGGLIELMSLITLITMNGAAWVGALAVVLWRVL